MLWVDREHQPVQEVCAHASAPNNQQTAMPSEGSDHVVGARVRHAMSNLV
jgi:hypothetical protein